jgi:hypothetical protein
VPLVVRAGVEVDTGNPSYFSQGEKRTLVLKQVALHSESAAEACERTVGANHPMARQDDRKRVAAVGCADRSGRLAAETESPCLLAVADRLAVRDRCKSPPALSIKLGSEQLEREVERHEVACEVRVELTRGGDKHS